MTSASSLAFPGSRITGIREFQHVISGLQLGEILDTFPDTSLKCLLQRQTYTGNADDRTACLQWIGKGGIEFGPEANQTGSVGCCEFENARKPGRRLEQIGTVAPLRTRFATPCRNFGCGRIAQRLQQKPDIGVTGGFRGCAHQP